MKILGKFRVKDGKDYFDLLQKNNIKVEAEDDFEGLNEVYIVPKTSRSDGDCYFTKLYVEERDFDKAKSLIKQYSLGVEQRVNKEAHDANKILLIIAVLFLLFIAWFIFHQQT